VSDQVINEDASQSPALAPEPERQLRLSQAPQGGHCSGRGRLADVQRSREIEQDSLETGELRRCHRAPFDLARLCE
jgi:hypothetical protein